MLAIMVSFACFAQTENVEYAIDDPNTKTSFSSLKPKDRLHYGFEMGASFSASNRFGDYFSTYYRPVVSYDVSPRFAINAGLTYVNSSVSSFPTVGENRYQLFSGNISQYYAFVSGEYKLSDKFSIGGSVFYDLTSYQPININSPVRSNNLDNLGYSAYFKYKINETMSIEGEIRINDRNPYNQYNSPFSNRSFGMGGSFFGR